jgi:F-type H+-transporting ATPase subunit b
MRRIRLIGTAALVCLLAAATPAAAADEHSGNPFELRFDLTVWSIIIFVILFFVLRRFAWGPILEGLKKREQSIAGAVEEAKRVREEMAVHQAEFQRKLDEAHQQIPKLMEEARKAADQLKEEMRTQAAAEINADRQRLHREIDVHKDQALQEIWNYVSNLATAISAQVIRKTLPAEDHRRLVDEALADIHARGQQGGKRAADLGAEWVRQAGGKI